MSAVTAPVRQRPPAADGRMVIEEMLPSYDVTMVEMAIVDADPEATWAALCDLDLLEVSTPLLDAAFWARELPERAVRRLRGRPPPSAPASMRFADAADDGHADRDDLPWVVLGVRPGHEIAFGAVGRFWRPVITWEPVSAEEFVAFDRPGWGKVAANFAVLPYGPDRSVLAYEARTATTDAAARLRFRRYWTVIRPFVRHVLRAVLDTVKTDAEQRVRAG